MLTTLVLLPLQELDELSASLASRIGKSAKGMAVNDGIEPFSLRLIFSVNYYATSSVTLQSVLLAVPVPCSKPSLFYPFAGCASSTKPGPVAAGVTGPMAEGAPSNSSLQSLPSATAELPPGGSAQSTSAAAAACPSNISSATAATAASSSHDPVPAEPAAMTEAERGAARAAAFAHVVTLSDDEDFLVVGGGVTDSEPDTEELMGRVDWGMAQTSDDYDVPLGWVRCSCHAVT